MNKKIIPILIVAIVVTGFLFFSRKITGFSVVDDNIKILLSEISSKVKFYEYEYDNTKIRYFVVKAKDGTIKTAFDACDVCGYTKKGYKQEGDTMVCNNCGNRYPIIGLGTDNKNPGGCWPGYLPNKIEGDNLIIKKSDLIKGVNRF